jgi:hypothetical protein
MFRKLEKKSANDSNNSTSNPNNGTDKESDCKENDDNNNFNDFGTYWKTFVKICVMLTGELDASDLDYENSKNSREFLLLIFLLTAIILYNFINGLAINDVQVSLSFYNYLIFINSKLKSCSDLGVTRRS